MLTKQQQQNLWGAGIAFLLALTFWPWHYSTLTQKENIMTIPATVYTGPAGNAAVATKTYTLNGSSDGAGYPYYTEATGPNIRWASSPGRWVFDGISSLSGEVSSGSGGTDNASYVSSAGQTLASGPVGAFAAGPAAGNTLPAPTVYLSAPSGTLPPIPRRRPVMFG